MELEIKIRNSRLFAPTSKSAQFRTTTTFKLSPLFLQNQLSSKPDYDIRHPIQPHSDHRWRWKS
jgi:hypothetical protein